MLVTLSMIRVAVQQCGLSGKALCVHSSLRSFGHIEGGARTLLEGLLAEGCTVMAPSFSLRTFSAPPPDSAYPARNGWSEEELSLPPTSQIYRPDTTAIDLDMGALPAVMVRERRRVRGWHPLNSFVAIGPQAEQLIAPQKPLAVYAPFKELCGLDGAILLMGVRLTSMTFLHYAEQQAGRTLFRRWANDEHGKPQMVEIGSCSTGFEAFAPLLAPFRTTCTVGESLWQVFPARATLEVASEAIRRNPSITACADPTCVRCRDAIPGGPMLDAQKSGESTG
uniref:Aminoglycoside N(3)-acetyltransferase n=1 Tax=Thermosporothrix sp. COM3 TaxID=2490863 RepID=A0A455STA7_9CHLR|nr:AAC(3) family N-acetyltransferase [Thermosporothrix sp. COM3]